jgi:hypothetical protein
MKQSRDFKDSMEKFDRLFRGVVAVPKSEVEKEEARERAKNQRKRAEKKAGKKSSTARP